jgi:hypothetical protein
MLPEHQDLKLFALEIMIKSLNQLCGVDTFLELECFCMSSIILELICAMLLWNCLSVWTRQLWGLTLKY